MKIRSKSLTVFSYINKLPNIDGNNVSTRQAIKNKKLFLAWPHLQTSDVNASVLQEINNRWILESGLKNSEIAQMMALVKDFIDNCEEIKKQVLKRIKT